jgi:methyl-accepting chemotaxis protein/hemerythrin
MNLTIETLTENKKKIAELIESFSIKTNQELCKNAIIDFLHKVSFYTENFFINEELFLKRYKMPSYEMHVNEHKQFVEKIMHFQKKLENNELNICAELYEYINDWYKNHILKNDKEIIDFIENNKDSN